MDSLESLLAKGEALTEEGRYEEAAKAFAGAIEADRDSLEASLGLAQVCVLVGLSDEAAMLLERVLHLAPEDPEALVLLGMIEEGRKDVPRALELFARAAGADPDLFEARYHLGRALVVAGRPAEAVTELEAAERLRPDAVEVLYALGVACRQLTDFGSSIAAFTRAIERDPTYLDGYGALTDVLAEAGRLELAEQVLEQAAALVPDLGAIYDKLAAVRLKKGDLPGVVDALQTRVRVDSDDEDAYVALYTAALMSGDAKSAADAVNLMIEQHPLSWTLSWKAHWLQAQMLDLGDRPDRAIESLREAHRLAPSEWKPLNDLGSLLNARALSQPAAAAEAVAVLESAVHLTSPSEAAPRYNLALAYWNAGSRDRARETLRNLLRDGPAGHRVLAQAREVLQAMEAQAGKT